MILVKIMVISFFAPEKPGVITEINAGAKKIRIMDEKIKIREAKLKTPLVKCQASLSSFLKYCAKIGIKAEYSGKVYLLARIEKSKAKGCVKVNKNRRLPAKPVVNHPWKSGESDGFKYDPRDKELYAGLYNSTIAWETDSY